MIVIISGSWWQWLAGGVPLLEEVVERSDIRLRHLKGLVLRQLLILADGGEVGAEFVESHV
jgi:hypothetical protein